MKREEALKLADKHSKLTAGFLFNAVTVHEMIEEAIAIEREACALVCEQDLRDEYARQNRPVKDEAYLFAAIADCASAIRARGSHD